MRRKEPKPLFCILGASLVTLLASGGVAAAAQSLPMLVVRSSPYPAGQERSPGSVTVLHPERMKGEFKTLPDLLEQSVGVHVMELRGRGGYSTASVRGSTAAQVAVYVDGVLQNLGSETAVDLSTIPLDSVERIEVYRGHVPARFGISGTGAVVDIITKEAEEAQQSITAGVGANGEWKSAFRYAESDGDGSLLVEGAADGSEGDFRYRNDNGTPYNPDDDYSATRRNNAYRNRNLLVKWSDGPWKTRLAWKDRNRELPLPAPGNDKGPKIEGATLDTERIAFDVGRDMGGGDIRWAWNLRYLNQEKRFDDPNDTLGMYSQRHNRYNTDRFSAGIEASTLLGGNHLVELFADHSREELDIRGDVVQTLGGQSSYTRDTTALTLSDSIYLLPDQSLTVVPLLRWNDVDGTGELSWSLATNWMFAPQWRLKASWGRYYRSPNLYELYGDGATLLPNEDLDWEENHQWDIGLHWEGTLMGTTTQAGLTYFNRRTDNLIEYVMINPRYGHYKNIGEAFVQGLELETALYGDLWDLTLSYTWMDSENRSEGYRDGNVLPHRPENSLYARYSRLLSPRLRSYLEVEYTGDNYFDDAETIRFEDLTQVNLGARWQLDGQTVLTAGVDDLFDETADTRLLPTGSGTDRLSWYPLPGRRWHLSVTWNF